MRGGSENEEEIGIPLASSDERAQKQRKVPKALREAAIKDWKWLLWDSNVAYDRIHPELGAEWTAVLKEACCVRKDKEKDKVNRLRKEGDRGPWRLWPKQKKVHDFFVTLPWTPFQRDLDTHFTLNATPSATCT